VREGAAPALEENLLLVEVNRLEAGRQMLASRETVLTLQLQALAGMEPEAPLALRGELAPAAPAVGRAEAVAHALSRRPDLEVARTDTAMARARIRKEEAEGRWDASVSVGYQRQDFGFSGLRGVASNGSLQPIQDVFHYFGAGVTITLPVRNRNQGNVAAAAAEVRAAERRQEFAVLVIRQEVEAAFTQFEAARRALGLYERGVREVARRNLDVVRRTWELGRGTLLDVIAEQRRLIEVENGYTDALKQVYDAAVEIDRSIGLTAAPRS
jgi:cobalt-zinc-cadmium efflux system outer membrane protein